MITIEITIKISSAPTIITMPVAAVEIRLVVDQSPGVVVGAVTMVDISKVKILIVVADNQITIAVDDVEKLKEDNNSLSFWK